MGAQNRRGHGLLGGAAKRRIDRGRQSGQDGARFIDEPMRHQAARGKLQDAGRFEASLGWVEYRVRLQAASDGTASTAERAPAPEATDPATAKAAQDKAKKKKKAKTPPPADTTTPPAAPAATPAATPPPPPKP